MTYEDDMRQRCAAWALAACYCTAERKDGSPALAHIINILTILASMGVKDEVTGVVAVLHDVIEDAYDTSPETAFEAQVQIQEEFTQDIVSMVDTLTHRDNEPYRDYITRICEEGEEEVLFIKIADMIDNLTGLPNKERKGQYRVALPKLIRCLWTLRGEE